MQETGCLSSEKVKERYSLASHSTSEYFMRNRVEGESECMWKKMMMRRVRENQLWDYGHATTCGHPLPLHLLLFSYRCQRCLQPKKSLWTRGSRNRMRCSSQGFPGEETQRHTLESLERRLLQNQKYKSPFFFSFSCYPRRFWLRDWNLHKSKEQRDHKTLVHRQSCYSLGNQFLSHQFSEDVHTQIDCLVIK
jgi:hypothetical protein